MHHTLPYPNDPAQFFSAFAAYWPGAVWLDSGGVAGTRYDIVAGAPRGWLTLTAGEAWWRPAGGVAWRLPETPMAAVRSALDKAPCGPAPFASGLIGYFGYDLGRRLAGLSAPEDEPEAVLARYDWAIVLDHVERAAWLAGPQAEPALAADIAAVMGTPAPVRHWRVGPIEVDLAAGDYGEAFRRVQDYLHAGDCYQINLARRFAAPFEGDPLGAWLALRRHSPGGYGAYLDLPGRPVLSVSPERFLWLREGRVSTRPIKGTRAREADPVRDRAVAEALASSPKDRAENLMIVDLLRNDLGRVCRIGSVRVPDLFTVERFATVHHLVSTVTGELPPGRDAVDLVAACLPGGSITGAPKYRAMQIIDELEPSARGVYCGAIGYLGDDGAMDTNIAIRTAVVRDGVIEYRAGGGLVADSEEIAEREETEAKAAAFFRLVGG
ncbi:aminodeoxychorismate synthase component I [Arhodomonas sp. AD133]|uniref:aminodeoxychorismate synthase component I n=1 Tax=Arhodomonas sp. AD133 TaxID=3415009 RepID=UPI003EBBC6AB